MGTKNNTPYREKGNLQGFLKIVYDIRLNRVTVFTFAVHALLGAIILPMTFKIVIETASELVHALMLENNLELAASFEQSLLIFQYIQWPLFIVIIATYWFRCNVKAYNYCFTQSVGAKIRRQLSESNAVLCPRCGRQMRIKRFTEKVREQTGEHEEYYTEWVNFGPKDSYTIRQTEIVSDYSDVEYKRQYAICENQYCMYTDKRPFKSDFRLYKFAEMPYKIADTINYAVRTKAKTNHAAGSIRQYAHGVPLLGYTGISIVMFVLSAMCDLSYVSSYNPKEFAAFMGGTILCECGVLTCGAICQAIVHLRNPRRDDDYVELKNRTRDGVTVVLPDGSEFYAKTDHELQRMADELSGKRND